MVNYNNQPPASPIPGGNIQPETNIELQTFHLTVRDLGWFALLRGATIGGSMSLYMAEAHYFPGYGPDEICIIGRQEPCAEYTLYNTASQRFYTKAMTPGHNSQPTPSTFRDMAIFSGVTAKFAATDGSQVYDFSSLVAGEVPTSDYSAHCEQFARLTGSCTCLGQSLAGNLLAQGIT